MALAKKGGFMEKVLDVEKGAFAGWAKVILNKYRGEIATDDIDLSGSFIVSSFSVPTDSSYEDVNEIARKNSFGKIPLSLIAFEVLSNPDFVSKKGFLLMDPLKDLNHDEVDVIFHVDDKLLKAYHLKKETIFPAGTVIFALKKK